MTRARKPEVSRITWGTILSLLAAHESTNPDLTAIVGQTDMLLTCSLHDSNVAGRADAWAAQLEPHRLVAWAGGP